MRELEPTHFYGYEIPVPPYQTMRKHNLLLLLSALLVAPLFSGCHSAAEGGGNAGNTPANPPAHPAGVIHLLIGVDVSGSTASDPKTRKRYCAQIEDTIDTIMPRETPVTIWFYDTDARLEFGPQKIQEGSELRPEEKKILDYRSPNQGTKQAAPLNAMLPVAKDRDSKGESVVCMLLTDSEDDDLKATKKVAAELAAIHGVRAVCISGAKTEAKFRNFMREKMTEALSPLGDRAVITGEGADTQGGLDRLKTLTQGGS